MPIVVEAEQERPAIQPQPIRASHAVTAEPPPFVRSPVLAVGLVLIGANVLLVGSVARVVEEKRVSALGTRNEPLR